MGQERRYVSSDPNFGTAEGEPERKYVSTDPNFGEPLRVASRTWADELGLNEGTDSMVGGFLRGSGSAAVDMLQGAVANLTNQANRHRVEMRTGNYEQPAPDVMTQPESVAGTIGAVGADMALPGAAGVKGGRIALNAIPRVARAGEKFQEVMGAARNIPIDVKDVGDVALRINQLAERGGSMPMAVRKILNRMTDPAKAPMAYEEARDFASNISRLSANEYGRLTPAVAREVAELRVVLNKANAQAAQKAGKLAEYESAMKEYAQAMRLRDAVEKATKAAKKAVPIATAGGVGYWLTRQVRQALGSE